MTRSSLARRVGTLALAALIAGLGFTGLLVTPGVEPALAAGEQADLLARPMNGRAAIDKLGGQVDIAARRNHMSPQALKQLMLRDHTAWLNKQGRMYYIDSAPAETAEATGAAATPGMPYPAGDTFTLHSRPNSTKTIYLDFNGHDISGSAWAEAPGIVAVHAAFNLDGVAGLSSAELTMIQRIWQRVTEDFVPFDVDVTTQEPAQAEITRSGDADNVYGTRVLITVSNNAAQALCDGNCGGTAFVGVFDDPADHDYYQPAWVFQKKLGDNEKYIAEAVSHEAGHTLALNHDNAPGQVYYGGHEMWAPIMGNSYYRPVSQWSDGSYAVGNNHEDDIAIIAAHGPGFAADDSGSTVATANPIQVVGAITTASDLDMWKLPICFGTLNVSAVNPRPSPNLDIKIVLFDAAGTVLQANYPNSAMVDYDTASGMSASLSRNVNGQQLYMRVEGTGRGTAAEYYTDYGSQGLYKMSATCS